MYVLWPWQSSAPPRSVAEVVALRVLAGARTAHAMVSGSPRQHGGPVADLRDEAITDDALRVPRSRAATAGGSEPAGGPDRDRGGAHRWLMRCPGRNQRRCQRNAAS